MGVKSSTIRNLVVFSTHSDKLTVADLRTLVDGQPDDAEVDLTVYVDQGDGPYSSGRTQVTFEIEVSE